MPTSYLEEYAHEEEGRAKKAKWIKWSLGIIGLGGLAYVVTRLLPALRSFF